MSEHVSTFASALVRTQRTVFGRIANVLGVGDISMQVWDELEATLIQADLGFQSASHVVENLREHVHDTGITSASQLHTRLSEELTALLIEPPPFLLDGSPTVILMVGVNGSGKTTTSAKLAKMLRDVYGARPILAACDTFRAAASQQLKLLGERIGVTSISAQSGADPGAVLFDAVSAAEARGADLVIADTAGRMHTKFNLMEELKKVCHVASKTSRGAPHHVLLVLDAVTGQNALSQARAFKESVGVTGVIVTKLDSSARGGVVFAIRKELGLPVQYVGLGENVDDLHRFEPQAFVAGLLI